MWEDVDWSQPLGTQQDSASKKKLPHVFPKIKEKKTHSQLGVILLIFTEGLSYEVNLDYTVGLKLSWTT